MNTDSSPPPAQATRTLLGRLVRDYVRPYFGRLAFAMLFMAAGAAATAANAWIMQPVLDDVFLDKNARMLILMPLIVLALAFVKGAADYGQAVFMFYASQRVIADIQKEMFAHLMRADIAFFHNTPAGNLISHFTNDLGKLRLSVAQVLTGMIKDTLTLVFLVAMMIYRDWQLALVAFFVFPVAVLPIVRIGRRLRKVSTSTQVQMGHFNTLLNQTFQGARQVKAYGMEKYESDRADGLIEGIFRLLFKTNRVSALSRPIMETLGGIAIALVIWYGGSRVIAGETTPGTFFSFITALLLAYQPMKSLANLNAQLQDGLAAAQRVFALLDVEPEIRDRPGARDLDGAGGGISFDGVSFSYGPGAPALHDISLDVTAGKTVAMVGPSGSGKSTILNLIPRFYDVGCGSVRVNGEDVRDLKLASLRAGIALVSQESSLFDDTVRANIAYGRFGCPEEEIVEAAKRAAAHDFITALPAGYDTMVGEHGVKLSGGQRQRIAIARAMLKNTPILLLDEATSALDTESERQVQAALRHLMKGRTTLVIAHRLSTVTHADIIYVIEAGRVAESGSHTELLAREGVYARLYELQFAGQSDRESAGAPGEAGRPLGARA